MSGHIISPNPRKSAYRNAVLRRSLEDFHFFVMQFWDVPARNLAILADEGTVFANSLCAGQGKRTILWLKLQIENSDFESAGKERVSKCGSGQRWRYCRL